MLPRICGCGVIGYSDHDCDRFEGVQIKEDIAVTNMNMTDIDNIALIGRNIAGEISYQDVYIV